MVPLILLMQRVYLEEMEFPSAMIVVRNPILVQLRWRPLCFWPLLALVSLNWGTSDDSLQYLSCVCTWGRVEAFKSFVTALWILISLGIWYPNKYCRGGKSYMPSAGFYFRPSKKWWKRKVLKQFYCTVKLVIGFGRAIFKKNSITHSLGVYTINICSPFNFKLNLLVLLAIKNPLSQCGFESVFLPFCLQTPIICNFPACIIIRIFEASRLPSVKAGLDPWTFFLKSSF